MADKMRINGNQYDLGSTSLKIDNNPIYGYKAVNWSHKRDRQLGWGSGKDRAPQGRSRGKYTPDNLKVTVRRDTASAIKLMLADRAADAASYGNAIVPVVFQYVEDESNQDPVTVEFVDCACVSDNGVSEEDGLDMVEMEFSYLRCEETIGGRKVTLFDAS